MEQKKRRQGAGAANGHGHHHGAKGGGGNGFIGLTIGGHSPDQMEGACEVACGEDASHVEETDAAPSLGTAAAGEVQYTARSDGDLIVHIAVPNDGRNPAAMIGRIVPVRVVEARPLSLMAELIPST